MTTRLEAVTRAGALLAAARAERDTLPTPEAVAKWANPGGSREDLDRLARFYTELQSTQGGPEAA